MPPRQPEPPSGLPEEEKGSSQEEEEEANVLLVEEAATGKKAAAAEEGGASWRPSPVGWFRMLARELHWSFVFGVVSTYGISQGLGGGIMRVASDYYWKDVQRVQPSAAQVYQGVTSIPWMVKPLWGLLTDVLPVAGYRRRPYFIFAGFMGVVAMLVVALHSKLHVLFALLALMAGSASVAIADVTIDACVAENSIMHPHLAADMISLNGFCASVGGLIGFSISGFLVHAIGSQGALGMLAIPSALVILAGVMIKDVHLPDFPYELAHMKFVEATRKMLATLKCPEVWRPCFYMYMSLALSVDIQEGMFYWYTDQSAGLSFSEGFIGFIYAIGSVGSLIGVILYQNILKDHSFRNLLCLSQLLLSMSGMLDLILVLRLNLKLGIPDYYFAVIDEGVSKMINRIKWMPLLVLSSKLCPPGIEGTFYALLMSIDNVGLLSGSWAGGLILHVLNITRTEFKNLWAAILIRNAMRLLPLALLFLVPRSDQNSSLLPVELLTEDDNAQSQVENVELTSLTVDGKSSTAFLHEECKIQDDVEQDDDEASLLANRS
ncbi:probable folate-biopterin transporter 2 [Oryza brachyantha]|uniref:probable folate-biopterin transporter 2 n=1 Tax=Oryza brachyantha TaxID=4533 RepID=UPI001ADCF89F|nr:probable folate-biopterin transporter 2 [Oryza brachyantha]XP_040381506.1 probable folate-biopterin transporter 2 [Oryza brachyantha]